ncbi:Tripartite ATP-independent periplasmic transporter DctQ component [Aminomonas paucivorans DSM 12260]|uniref:Tripartite ATP-independent periplasmic transporter DctQ component n=1 Tax=Aminomonas paucivorans DSM 12260 TaxID=584708 RepID=E3CXQ9_9BACT|nr:TRAP transporter small permease [Aminomonas paucivorans]EFQ22652.1 Tripartite ATP-independent periplasmic transporter DctQ component [Aminomonas paucivorans DSM 12260]
MLKKWFDNAEEYLLVGSLAFNVVLVFFQVVMRYVFQNSLSWSEELARYIFLWQTWLGASYAVKEHRHLRVEMLADRFKGRARLVFELFVLVVWFGFSGFLAYQGYQMTSFLAQSGQTSAAMQIPISWAYASVPVGCGLMALRLVGEIRRVLAEALATPKEV